MGAGSGGGKLANQETIARPSGGELLSGMRANMATSNSKHRAVGIVNRGDEALMAVSGGCASVRRGTVIQEGWVKCEAPFV